MFANEKIERILTKGDYFVFHEFTGQDQAYDFVKRTILQGIQEIQGFEQSEAIEKAGLAKMHEYFDPDNVLALQRLLEKKANKELIKMTYDFGRNDLGLEDQFFIDTIVVYRIHYPYTHAIKGKIRFADTVWPKPKSTVENIKSKVRRRIQSPRMYTRFDILRFSYFKDLPLVAWTHGPHIDPWVGHSYNGINLWWSIAGVEEDNGLILYPGAWGDDFAHLEEPPYIAPGATLPKPQRISIPDGSLLAFNPEILHGTHVNISDQTRIVITTRLNPVKPTFDTYVKRHVKKWYQSEEIAKGEIGKVREFDKEENLGQSLRAPSSPRMEKRISLSMHSQVMDSTPIELCSSETLPVGERMLVPFKNVSIVVVRTKDGLFALNAECPHFGLNLVDGYHDDQCIYCPGHGLQFRLADGSSQSDLFKVKAYKAYDRDGKIFVEK